MAEEHFTRASPIECRLMSSVMEIDDDDQDIVQVKVELSNEAAIPIGGLEIFIQTSDKIKVEAEEGISSLGPGLTRMFTFEFPLQSGEWTFMLRSDNVSADLGPYDHDFTFEAKKGRVFNNTIGSGLFTDAFSTDLDDFGNVEERGVIDASEIVMTSYVGENSRGGATAISVDDKLAGELEENGPKTPPWEKDSEKLLAIPVQPSQPVESTNLEQEQATSTADLLSFSNSLHNDKVNTESSKTAADSKLITSSTPPPLPPPKANQAQKDILSKPPTGPPTGPPTTPPEKPPSKPSSKPPTGPPSGPPAGPPGKSPKSKKPPKPDM